MSLSPSFISPDFRTTPEAQKHALYVRKLSKMSKDELLSHGRWVRIQSKDDWRIPFLLKEISRRTSK